jgi:hypothetical protein
LLTNFKFWRQATGHSLKVKLGRFQPPRGKSILICIEGPPSDWIDNFMRNFRESNPRENVFLLDGDMPTLPLAGGDSLPYPIPLFGVTRRFLRRLRARVILVDKGVTPPRKFLSSALVNDVSIAYLEIPPDRNPSGRTHAMSPGQSPSAKIVGGLKDYEGQESVAVIAPLLAREMEAYINLKKRMKFFLWERVTFRLYAKRLHKLTSFAEINASLGNPESILCLGNGPSSEDARLSILEHDAIFRVNHRWLDRGLFTAADAIFTGALDSVLHFGKDALYIFIENERSMRIIRKAKKKIQRLSFTNAEDLGFPVEEFYPYQPTNGLIMIYVAVNLRPDKLIIAGIDLYRDPRGCYPGETSTPNVYTSGHDEDRELDLMLCLLASYQGNLTIIGDGLEFEYERYISENREQV